MMRKIITTAICLVLVSAAAASAAPPTGIHGRGPHARAALYATTLDLRQRPIQVLDALCANPQTARRCRPLNARLRHAITVAVRRPITWVDEMQKLEGVFWVLTRIGMSRTKATFASAWTEPGAYGCNGGGRSHFHLIGHQRVESRDDISYSGCP